LTYFINENKSRTSHYCWSAILTWRLPWEGLLYISNQAPKDATSDEILLIAHEVRELCLLLLEQGEQATHCEISYVIFMMNCLIQEAERVSNVE